MPSPTAAPVIDGSSLSAAAVAKTVATRPDGAGQAAVGPIPEPISAAGYAAPGPLADSPSAAQGRRTLSTAFVRIGPDGHLTVELRDGAVLVLRDVVMNRKDYCGVRVGTDAARGRYCGGYAEVAAARPGGAPTPGG